MSLRQASIRSLASFCSTSSKVTGCRFNHFFELWLTDQGYLADDGRVLFRLWITTKDTPLEDNTVQVHHVDV